MKSLSRNLSTFIQAVLKAADLKIVQILHNLSQKTVQEKHISAQIGNHVSCILEVNWKAGGSQMDTSKKRKTGLRQLFWFFCQ